MGGKDGWGNRTKRCDLHRIGGEASLERVHASLRLARPQPLLAVRRQDGVCTIEQAVDRETDRLDAGDVGLECLA